MRKCINIVLALVYISCPNYLFALNAKDGAEGAGSGTPSKAVVKENTGTSYDVDNRLRVRLKPNLNAKITGYLYAGNEVNVTAVSGNWYQVSNGSVSGWSCSDYLTPTEYGGNEGTDPENSQDGVAAGKGIRNLYGTASLSKVPPQKDNWFTKFIKNIKRKLEVLKDSDDDDDGDIANEVERQRAENSRLEQAAEARRNNQSNTPQSGNVQKLENAVWYNQDITGVEGAVDAAVDAAVEDAVDSSINPAIDVTVGENIGDGYAEADGSESQNISNESNDIGLDSPSGGSNGGFGG